MVGISTDDVGRLGAWKARTSYPYHLLSDADHAVIEAYGQWREKEWPPGRRSMGTARTTMLIDADGLLRRTWEEVMPRGHARDVVAALTAGGPQI